MHSSPRRRTLLLTLDAFNTLFHPRLPVPVQYTQTATSFGFLPANTSPDTVQSAFRAAFKHQTALRPNYGREIPGFGGPKAWWAAVIRGCFAEVKGNGAREEDVPDELVGRLISIFEGNEGYALYPDVMGFFERLRMWKERWRSGTEVQGTLAGKQFDCIVVGILSNSDDRVAPILNSLGLSVGAAWANDGKLLSPSGTLMDTGHHDLDFMVTSYEAWSEKPQRKIFKVAEKRAKEHLLRTASDRYTASSINDQDSWSQVHIGDDYEQDYKGAIGAGWDSYLLSREGIRHLPEDRQSLEDVKHIKSLSQLLQGPV